MKLIYEFKNEEFEELYFAYDIDVTSKPDELSPKIISTGLNDILLPVKNKEILNAAKMNSDKVKSISKKYDVVGIHMFCLGDNATAYCRNFAPLYGIEEESATGTANGALTFYLKNYNIIKDKEINTFVQGEIMERESKIYSIINENNIRVGGQAKISLECFLKD